MTETTSNAVFVRTSTWKRTPACLGLARVQRPSLVAHGARLALVACALLLSPACGTTTDLCTKNPPNAECEQCRTLPRAKECPQCQGAMPDPDCESARDGGAGVDAAIGGSGGNPLPLVDGSLVGGGGASGASGMDGGGGTGGSSPDASMDAGPCAQGCPGATPHCLSATDTCVECRKNADCDGAKSVCDPATHECVECLAHDDCDGSKPRCDAAAHECVECLAHADCDDATAAKCATGTHTCVPCTASSQCEHIAGKTVCDAADGECVECAVADESACAAHSCDPATLTCTSTPLASVGVCETCVADSECEADHRCIPMFFMGAARAGGYCMKVASTGCSKPYGAAPISRASLSGVAAVTYCTLDETKTTCEAVLALVDALACPGDLDCASLDGGRCETVNSIAGQCTYSCDTSLECPTVAPCDSGYCGGPP